jgi:hypothetical protein
MATDTIPGPAPVCKAARDAYYQAALTCDSLYIDADRLAETAYALSASELFSEGAQHSFHSLGVLAERIAESAKEQGEHFDAARGAKVETVDAA